MRKAKRTDTQKQVRELYRNGYSINEIVNILGLSKQTVYSYLPKKEEREKKKREIAIYIGFKQLSLEEKIKEMFKNLKNIKMEKICELDDTIKYRVKGEENKEYYITVCKGEIEFVLEKDGCTFKERYDLAYTGKLKKLILELNDALQKGLSKKEVDILLSPEYSVDVQFTDKEKRDKFVFRAWRKGGKEYSKKFIPIVNSTKKKIYNIVQELIAVRKKVFRNFY